MGVVVVVITQAPAWQADSQRQAETEIFHLTRTPPKPLHLHPSYGRLVQQHRGRIESATSDTSRGTSVLC